MRIDLQKCTDFQIEMYQYLAEYGIYESQPFKYDHSNQYKTRIKQKNQHLGMLQKMMVWTYTVYQKVLC